MRIKLIFLGIWFGVLSHGCFGDECAQPGLSWCEQNIANTCEEDSVNENSAFILKQIDCTQREEFCVNVESLTQNNSNYINTEYATCIQIDECESLGEYRCGEPQAGETSRPLLQCVQLHKTLPRYTLNAPNISYAFTAVGQCLPCLDQMTCSKAGEVCEAGLCLPVSSTILERQ